MRALRQGRRCPRQGRRWRGRGTRWLRRMNRWSWRLVKHSVYLWQERLHPLLISLLVQVDIVFQPLAEIVYPWGRQEREYAVVAILKRRCLRLLDCLGAANSTDARVISIVGEGVPPLFVLALLCWLWCLKIFLIKPIDETLQCIICLVN